MYDPKNLIVEDIGNFRDCIDNIAYTLQRYVDQFIIYIPSHASELKRQGCDADTLSFLIGESSNILRYKLLASARDTHDLLTRKLTKVITNIKEEYHDYTFYIAEYAEKFYKDSIDQSNLHQCDEDSYHYDSNTIDNHIYNFVDLIKHIYAFYDESSYGEELEVSSEKLVELLITVKKAMHTKMLGLRDSMELSVSTYNAALFMHIILEYAASIYYLISNITILKP